MNIGRWLRNHPRGLERAYLATRRLMQWLDPAIRWVGYGRFDRWLRPIEEVSKGIVFDCRMCGQCTLHSTGMTCPMTCPKTLRNGPCGGVRVDGRCEVVPQMMCVWVEAYERSRRMAIFGDEMLYLQPPVNRQLEGSSAWVNMLTGLDRQAPAGWVGLSQIPVISVQYSVSSNRSLNSEQ
jgi:hypothetical protein